MNLHGNQVETRKAQVYSCAALGDIMRTAILLLGLMLAATPARASDLVEPHMRIAGGGVSAPQVALTLDACAGGIDTRILDALIENRIPATLFITGVWLNANPQAAAILAQHADLFEVENHGAEHIPAVIGSEKPYGITPAGTPEAVMAEVTGGAFFVQSFFGHQPGWYRDATALYSPDAIDLIKQAGFRIGGFSLNGDAGASFSTDLTAKTIGAAEDGDVIIAHVNQPARPAGAGVVEGILALKARGYSFVRLDEVTVIDD